MAKSKYNGILPNKRIYINKTYKNYNTQSGKIHSMFYTETHKDETGNYVTDGSYNLRWFDNDDYVPDERISIVNIDRIEQQNYLDKKTNRMVTNYCITVKVAKYDPNANNAQGGYGVGGNPNYQGQYAQSAPYGDYNGDYNDMDY